MPLLYVHETYGLRIASGIRLRDLPYEEAFSCAASDYDVIIRAGSIPTPAPEVEPAGEGCWRANSREAFYHWSRVGSLLVQDGSCITYDMEKGVDPTVLHLALLGPGLATILHQRGLLVLHASAVQTDRGVVGFVGPSGRGKSTAASSLVERGYELFTDDLLAIRFDTSGPPLVASGPAQVRLWPESAEALGYSPDTLSLLGEHFTKRVRHVERELSSSAVPLQGIYLIQKGGGLPEITQLAPRHALMQLMTHCYCSEVLRFCGERDNFRQSTELLRRVPVKALSRGESLGQLSSLADTIIRDLAPQVG